MNEIEITNQNISISVDSNAVGPVDIEVSNLNVTCEFSGLGIQGPPGDSGTKSKSLTIVAPASTEDVPLFYADVVTEISKILIAVQGGGDLTWNILISETRNGAGGSVFASDEVSSSTETFTVFDTSEIPAGRFVRFVVTDKTGTILDVHLTLFFTV